MLSLANTPKQVSDKIKKYQFNEAQYKRIVEEYYIKKNSNRTKLLEEIQVYLFVAQITNNQEQKHLVEKILVQLLGFSDVGTRDNAVVLLNSLYDDNDW